MNTKHITHPSNIEMSLSDVKKRVEIDVNNVLHKKFRMINPLTFQKIFRNRSIYRYYKQFNFNMSVYDLLKTANNNTNLRKVEVDKYKRYFNDTVFTRNTRLIGHLYNINKTKISFDKLLVKRKFNKFLTSNNLYQIFNLKRDLPYPNYLQLKSEIQRSTVFRDLVNKESAYYRAVKRSPLVLLVSPKPKNIYITIYILSTNGYRIIWKKSTGMLEKVEGQLSLAALIEIFNKINIFLTKNYLKLKHPLKLIIKSSKYYGTTNIIQNFVKIFQNNLKLNYIYFMYKYRKRFNFFSEYADLINDSLFNYLSSIWIKFLKIIKKTKLPRKYIFSRKILDSYNKFFGLDFDYAKRRYKINHFTRLRRIKFLRKKKFIKNTVMSNTVKLY